MEVLKKYQAEMKEFCHVDEMNLSDRLRKVPESKHFWNTQYIDAKIGLSKLEKELKKLKLELFKKISKDPSVTKVVATDTAIKKLVEEQDSVLSLQEKIEEQKVLVEWLELNIKTISFISQDFKNIIDLKKIEEF